MSMKLEVQVRELAQRLDALAREVQALQEASISTLQAAQSTQTRLAAVLKPPKGIERYAEQERQA